MTIPEGESSEPRGAGACPRAGPTGTLYVVATPIGNLEDLSLRALRILREVAVIAAEDTRVTRKLLSRHEIRTPLTAYHSHSSAGRVTMLLERLLAGDHIALVSDAGTPGISDPGGLLVRAAVDAGLTVVPIPGPSAVIAALSASGLDPTRFVFEGFLPRARGEAMQVLERLRPLPHTLVFYEAPGRVGETLARIEAALPGRRAVVARELTKLFEEFARGATAELAERFRADPPRGECVLLVSGSAGNEALTADQAPDLEAEVRAALAAGGSVRDVARDVAARLKAPRKEVYALAQRLHNESAALKKN